AGNARPGDLRCRARCPGSGGEPGLPATSGGRWQQGRPCGAHTRAAGVRPSHPRGPLVKLEGIHHITAITADAQRNVDFYVDVMGLRLVKKSVNQDDTSVYHLFYA